MVRWSLTSRRERKRRPMGINCSSVQDDSDSNAEKPSKTPVQTPSETVRIPHHACSSETMADDRRRPPTPRSQGGMGLGPSQIAQSGDQYSLLDGYDSAIDRRLAPPTLKADLHYTNEKEYNAQRELLHIREGALAYDYACKMKSTSVERRANQIVQAVKRRDIELVYEAASPRTGYGGQKHPRFFGDHFLSNAELIEQTWLFGIARKMPKGAHLHIHFNANLLPNVLVDIAKTMEHMYIMSNVPLMTKSGDSAGFDRCKISFSIISRKKIQEKRGETGHQSLFDVDYISKEPMPFRDFCDQFQRFYNQAHGKKEDDRTVDVDSWLRNKLVFQEEETYNLLQTADGAWEKFNGRTQMMKGLFNYVTAYRRYTQLCLAEFVDDNIQYAEIRPNFMATNQVWLDDGSAQLDNQGIMNLIMEEYDKYQLEHRRKVLKGLKIIYCTPRSFDPKQVEASLNECLDFKQRWPEWIAGFDLVGEESKGRPLKDFVPEFLRFKKKCADVKIDIPFLFHCGETLSIGEETDGNLFDALLLGSKRIGHGFALPRHPYVMEKMKAENICVEVCPISNEILGLTPRMNGHAVYSLLANNVHCTVSTDNGTLFRSRLSHDFYQMMAGKSDMTLHGWRQLIEWSIEHSCTNTREKAELTAAWLVMWDKFCQDIINAYEGKLKGYLEPGNDNDEIMGDGP
ncbi:adenosine deaminase CECR1 [Naviculisporaceae sp. PSN 640]